VITACLPVSLHQQGVFHVTDLPSIVSGDKLFFFDPSGAVLGGGPGDVADAAGKAPQALGKAFTFVGSDLPRRFAHSFAPFPGCNFGAPVSCTLLRLPLRASADSPLRRPACTPAMADALLRALLPAGERALLFLASVQRLSVCTWALDAPAASALLLDACVTSCDAGARGLCDDKEWKRTSFMGLFAGMAGTKRCASLTIQHRRAGDGVDAVPAPLVTDTYVVSGVIGAGKARDKALDRRTLSQLLLPYAAAAAHITRNGAPVAPTDAMPAGGLFAPLPLAGDASALSQLPFALMGCFALSRAGGRRLHPLSLGDGAAAAVRLPPGSGPATLASAAAALAAEAHKAGWNRDLLECAASAVVELLTEAGRLARASPTLSSPEAVRAHYALWPRRAHLAGAPDGAAVAELLLKPLYLALSERPLLRLRDGSCVRASDGIFLPAGSSDASAGRLRAQAFLAAHHPVVDAPPELRAEFEGAGVRDVRELTPSALRKLLRGAPPRGAAAVGEEAVETQLELLDIVFSDLIAPPPPAAGAAGGAAAAPAAPASVAAAALGAVPGSTAAGLAAIIDSAGLVDAATLRALPGMLPAGLAESATQMLIDSGLGGAAAGGAPGAPPLHALRLRELQGVLFPTADKRLLALGSEAFIAPASAATLLPGAAGRVAHPRCTDAPHGAFFNHPGFQAALNLKPLTLPRLAGLLHTALPSRCIQPGAAALPWDRASPPAEWLYAFWAHVAAAAPAEAPPGRRGAQMDAFSAFALLPTVGGELVRVSHREMVFVPPPGAATMPVASDAAAAAASADAAAAADATQPGARMASALAAMAAAVFPTAVSAPRPMRDLWPSLEPILLRLNAPVLDVSCGGAAMMCAATNKPPDGCACFACFACLHMHPC
jgi:hypothetical protein